MSDDGGQPLDREHYQMLTNAGRCVICGRTVDMRDAGDRLVVFEPTLPDDFDGDFTDQDAADSIADALERLTKYHDAPANWSLAEALRDEGGYIAHKRCEDEETTMDLLLVEHPPRGTETDA